MTLDDKFILEKKGEANKTDDPQFTLKDLLGKTAISHKKIKSE